MHNKVIRHVIKIKRNHIIIPMFTLIQNTIKKRKQTHSEMNRGPSSTKQLHLLTQVNFTTQTDSTFDIADDDDDSSFNRTKRTYIYIYIHKTREIFPFKTAPPFAWRMSVKPTT